MQRIFGTVGVGRCLAVVATVSLAVAGAGCRGADTQSASDTTAGGAAAGVARPARINHIVFAKLKDPAAAEELIAASRRLLPRIPGVTMFSAGRHLDIGRSTVNGDYDVAMYIGFDAVEDYRVYVDHPEHVAFVAAWKPRLEWLRVHDFTDSAYPPRDLPGERARERARGSR